MFDVTRKADPRDVSFDLSAGRPDRLGARPDPEGTNFALFSDNAEKVELCLFDEAGTSEIARLELPRSEGGIWYGYLPGIAPGQAYGYRVHGAYAPKDGHRFNPNKLLLDPYAMAMRGHLTWDDALFGYPVGGSDLEFDTRDSAPFMPKAVVADPDFDWEAEQMPRTPWEKTVIYEAHAKGLTMRHPGVIEADRGTFKALASDPMLEHLQKLGVTAIELLPIHAMVQDRYLVDQGLRNYWGYNTLGFFAPNRTYLAGEDVREVRTAVKRFHDAGIEVILDVVYNHTAEGNELGSTLSFRGIDNASYYLLSEDKRHCFDTTGCGNTLNVAHPMVLRMVMDSLRYWVEVCHVDGFRFDLASTLGREPAGFEREGSFFSAMRQDPVLSQVKLIAEPWDIGSEGYQVGGFPWPFREWNDKFRDDTRAFWRRDPGMTGRISQRLMGSPTQFDHSLRPATSSVNFIAAHDGFTLWDTLSYNDKHNEANGEGNRDGHDHNLSDNMGAEGPSEDAHVDAARLRRAKAMLATLFTSHGVPMILAGDELGQSQQGNNNAYCQDNEIAWIDWDAARPELTQAVADMIAFRKDWAGHLAPAGFWPRPEATESHWLHPEGREMSEDDWNDDLLRVTGLWHRRDDCDDLLIVLNAMDDCEFALPAGDWRRCIDTAQEVISCDEPVSGTVIVSGQAVSVFRTGAPQA
ncbi:glycogen debranching protein GlgX [Salipiger sp. 1_MG-2023]|uniref:glycogen debranching protein GlgX n=1 Tax=Salipiger sp. 1_MG-2023 TaxID=3062665 RepID=UPI0026E47C07|nr:glycogen debranching protein GlgX [Salipiger sp. 1_MG-2023]MDO6585292.1 glycogen debranching protein GlgX [Salipiger sp. 1_MG-2023]